MGTPRIAAVIVQYGQWQKTIDSVASLLRSTLVPHRIIVVDNASPDDSATRLARWLCDRRGDSSDGRLSLLPLAENRGYAAGNNAGIRAAPDADAWLVLNNDATLAPGALEAMWAALESSPHPGLCGPTVAYPPKKGAEPMVQCCAGGHTNYKTGLSSFAGAGLTVSEAARLEPSVVEKNLNFVCGACVLVSREFLSQVGPMDEGFFLYCEEQDWAIRAAGRFSLTWARQALCVHQEGASTGWSRQNFSWRRAWRLVRSRLRLAFLHHPWYLPTVALGCAWAPIRLLAKKLAPGRPRQSGE